MKTTCTVPDCDRPGYCKGLCTRHYQRLRVHGSLEEPTTRRFWANVDKSGEHWLWTGTQNENGYGRYNNQLAHRMAYELLVGQIPDGLPLDHVCRVTSCVRPDHLEPVTPGENVRRGYCGNINAARQNELTHCIRGHEFDEANTRVTARGARACRACARLRRSDPDRYHATKQPGRIRIDIGRSLGAAIRAETSLAGSGHLT